jgi:putative membrane-bound dehydrogenase-like protein
MNQPVRPALLCLLFAASLAQAAPEPVPSLKTPADWKVEVIAKPPELKWPSVVEAAPDGRIFVAEDPMDMPGPSRVPADRVLCIFPDGHITVFADKLYAVFGLRYIDGKLYVHHTPKLSVFTDDHGIGKDRHDLYDSDNPNPAPGFNDHIPSNIRLAMDGYLYMSTGDKGIYGAKSNIDGKTAEIHGGGVLRIRPDGRDMEVYATGTRNHLDLALNDEDEIFTYDNTDDGQGWWTRYTHMIDGGYYGYPFDYKVPGKPDDPKRDHNVPLQPYTLWRMAEYGGGAPTGACGYNEDALPEEYRGNTFMCEWGKGRFERFVVARDGGTYKVVKLETMISGPKFRPVGCSVTADGTGLLVTDWEYGGWQNPEVHGRLLRLTYTGAMHPTPRPAWYVPAAQGEKFTASIDELVTALSHPAEAVRLVAQRRLADRGAEAVAPLTALLKDTSRSPFARRHAIWALDAIDGGAASRGAIIAVASTKDEPSVHRQALRQLGTRRATEATDACVALLDSDDASLRERAAIALGRIGNRAAVPALLAHLPEHDFFTHYSIFTALNRIGRADPAAWPYIAEGLRDANPAIRGGTLLAIRETYDKPLVEALAAVIHDSSAPTDARVAAVGAIASLHRQRPAWDGHWWATQPAGSLPPAKSVDWDGTPLVASAIDAALKDSAAPVVAAAVAAMQAAPSAQATDTLVALFGRSTDPRFKKIVIEALAHDQSPAALKMLTTIFSDPAHQADLIPDAIVAAESIASPAAAKSLIDFLASNPTPDQRIAATAALGNLRSVDAIPVIAKGIGSDNPQVAIAAADALGKIAGHSAATAIAPALQDNRLDVRRAAIAATGTSRDRDSVPVLMGLLNDPQTEADATAALTRMPDDRATAAYLKGLGSADAGLRDQSRQAITRIADSARPKIEELLAADTRVPAVAIESLRKIYAKPEPITKFKMVGPFPIDAKPPFALDAMPASAQFTGAQNKPTKWVDAKAGDRGSIDVSRLFSITDNVSAFAVAEIKSATDADTSFEGGSDDGLILWLNGREVYRDTSEHGYEPDKYHFRARLKAGANLLVAQTLNVGAGWEFSVRVKTDGTGPIFTYKIADTSPESYAKYAAAHDGDPAAGNTLFHNVQSVGCIKCHTVGTTGGIVGPNLSGIALKYDKAKLIDDVLYPSKQIESGYEQTIIRTTSGDIESGVVKSESDTEVTMYDSAARKIVIRKSDIKARRVSKISAMPEGLQAGISQQQFADIVAYLLSLKEQPAQPAAK